MVRCIASVGQWMASNRLMLNPTKSEFIWFVSPCRIHLIDIWPFVHPDDLFNVSSFVRNLGTFFMSDHVIWLVQSCFYHLRRIKFIRLTSLTTKMLVNSFIISRVDYCNSILAGIPKYQICRVQCSSSHLRSGLFWPHNTNTQRSAALTRCPRTDPVRKVPAYVQGTPRIHSRLHHWGLHCCLIRLASMLIFAAATPCSMPFQDGHARRAILLCLLPESMEQTSGHNKGSRNCWAV